MVAVLLVATALRLVAFGRVPPGLYHDEAYHGLDALGILQGHLSLYFPANNGREPLFIYLVGLAVGVLGRSPFALRMAAFPVGLLTVAATAAMGRALFSRRVGLLGAAVLAVTLWHVHLSRIGFRAILLPLFVALTVWQVARGMRSARRCHWLAAGLLYGLSFYTYTAARFTPVALAAFGLYVGRVVNPPYLRIVAPPRLGRGVGLAVLAALITIVPLAVYAVGHPDVVLGRPGQVSVFDQAIHGGDLWSALGAHLLRTLGMFFVRGDRIWRHNVPWRPVFDPLLGAAFVLGLLVALRRVRRDAAAGFVLVWTGVMVLPTLLAEDAPHFLRAVGVLPVVALLPALGLDWSVEAILRGRPPRPGDPLWSPTPPGRARRPAPTETRLRAGTEARPNGGPPQRRPVLGRARRPAPTETRPRAGTEARPNGDPPQGGYGGPPQRRPVLGRARRPAPTEARPYGAVVVAAVLLFSLGSTVWAYFGDYARDPMTGYWFEDGAVALAARVNRFLGVGWDGEQMAHGDPANRRVYLDGGLWEKWPQVRFLVAAPEAVTVGLDEVLSGERSLSPSGGNSPFTFPNGGERGVVAVFVWPYGDWQRAWALLPVPAEIAVEEGSLSQGDCDPEPYMTYLAFFAGVPDSTAAALVHFSGGVELLDVAVTALDGGRLGVRLRWRATAPLAEDYTVFLHYLRDGKRIAQADARPAGGYYPTIAWRPGDVVDDDHYVESVGAPLSGRDALRIGLWQPESGTVLHLLNKAGDPAGDWIVVPVEARGP